MSEGNCDIHIEFADLIIAVALSVLILLFFTATSFDYWHFCERIV